MSDNRKWIWFKWVWCDLDGTLADCEHRRHWLDAERHPELTPDERWRRFFAECGNDQPNEALIAILRALRLTFKVAVVSARSDEVKAETIAWLKQYGIGYDLLMMREAGDRRPDVALKAAWLKQFGAARIAAVFDDRMEIVEMWRAHGLLCCQVAPGVF